MTEITNNPIVANKEPLSKKLVALIPLFSIIIVILSVISNSLYFYNFNVPIKYFTSLSELPLMIASDLLVIALSSIIGCILLLIFFQYKSQGLSKMFNIENKKYENKLVIVPNQPTDLLWRNNVNPSVKRPMFRVLIVFTVLSLAFGVFIPALSFKIIGFAFFIIFLSVTIFFYFLSGSNKVEKLSILLLCIGVMETYAISTSLTIIAVEDGLYKGTFIETKDNTGYISTDSTFFIGKTEKYIFIYRKKDSSTLIIPSESIKQMVLKQNK